MCGGSGPGGATGSPGNTTEPHAPHALADCGFTEDSIAEAADAIQPSVPLTNPHPATADDLRTLLRAAWVRHRSEACQLGETGLARSESPRFGPAYSASDRRNVAGSVAD